MSTLLFVYGTLKRGCCNHAQLAGQRFVGPARTTAGFRLFDVGGYPGLVAHPDDRVGVSGEVWEVDTPCLRALDEFEGLPEGLYRRERIALLAPFADNEIEAYHWARNIVGRPEVGACWTEPRARRA